MERRTVRMRLKRTELLDFLDLADEIHLAQTTVGDDGEIILLLEGENLPLIAKRGASPHIHFSDIQDDGNTYIGTELYKVRNSNVQPR